MGSAENGKDQLGRQSNKCRSSSETGGKQEYFKHNTTAETRIGHILRHESLLCNIIEGRMLGKATRGRKRLQMLSDVSSKTYKDLKRQDGDRIGWLKRLS